MDKKTEFDMADVFGITPLEEEREKAEKDGIPEFKGMTIEQQTKRITELFREVFGDYKGKIVLGIMLEDLYYFRDCKNDEARALNNYAKILISQRLGFNDNSKRVESLFNCK